jgi:hypothetical protein
MTYNQKYRAIVNDCGTFDGDDWEFENDDEARAGFADYFSEENLKHMFGDNVTDDYQYDEETGNYERVIEAVNHIDDDDRDAVIDTAIEMWHEMSAEE